MLSIQSASLFLCFFFKLLKVKTLKVWHLKRYKDFLEKKRKQRDTLFFNFFVSFFSFVFLFLNLGIFVSGFLCIFVSLIQRLKKGCFLPKKGYQLKTTDRTPCLPFIPIVCVLSRAYPLFQKGTKEYPKKITPVFSRGTRYFLYPVPQKGKKVRGCWNKER